MYETHKSILCTLYKLKALYKFVLHLFLNKLRIKKPFIKYKRLHLMHLILKHFSKVLFLNCIYNVYTSEVWMFSMSYRANRISERYMCWTEIAMCSLRCNFPARNAEKLMHVRIYKMASKMQKAESTSYVGNVTRRYFWVFHKLGTFGK